MANKVQSVTNQTTAIERYETKKLNMSTVDEIVDKIVDKRYRYDGFFVNTTSY